MRNESTQTMTSQYALTRFCLCLLIAGAMMANGCSHIPTAPDNAVAFDPNYHAWNEVLMAHATAEGIDYAALAGDPAALDRTLAEMAAVGPEDFRRWPRAEKLAFLINAHNAHAAARIVRHYPTGSLAATRTLLPARSHRDIALLGKRWSLKSLADEIMGQCYQDSRLIFLLNWAEQGCAALPKVAATGRNLDYLADRQVRACLAGQRHQQYDPHAKIIRLTPMADTYRGDLERDYTTLWVFLEKFLPAETAERIKKNPPRIRFLAFDHSLNQWPRPEQVSISAEAIAIREEETKKALDQTNEALDLIDPLEESIITPPAAPGQ